MRHSENVIKPFISHKVKLNLLSVGTQGPCPAMHHTSSLGSPCHLTLSIAETSSAHTNAMSHNSLHLTVLLSPSRTHFHLLIFCSLHLILWVRWHLQSKSWSLLQIEPGPSPLSFRRRVPTSSITLTSGITLMKHSSQCLFILKQPPRTMSVQCCVFTLCGPKMPLCSTCVCPVDLDPRKSSYISSQTS